MLTSNSRLEIKNEFTILNHIKITLKLVTSILGCKKWIISDQLNHASQQCSLIFMNIFLYKFFHHFNSIKIQY